MAVIAASGIASLLAVPAHDRLSADDGLHDEWHARRPGSRHHHGYHHGKDALIKRLHRIEGQVRGIERMVSGDRYCIDILTQIGAVSTALDSLGFQILDEHVKHCVAGALASGDEAEAQAKAAELLEAVHRFAKTR